MMIPTSAVLLLELLLLELLVVVRDGRGRIPKTTSFTAAGGSGGPHEVSGCNTSRRLHELLLLPLQHDLLPPTLRFGQRAERRIIDSDEAPRGSSRLSFTQLRLQPFPERALLSLLLVGITQALVGHRDDPAVIHTVRRHQVWGFPV